MSEIIISRSLIHIDTRLFSYDKLRILSILKLFTILKYDFDWFSKIIEQPQKSKNQFYYRLILQYFQTYSGSLHFAMDTFKEPLE